MVYPQPRVYMPVHPDEDCGAIIAGFIAVVVCLPFEAALIAAVISWWG